MDVPLGRANETRLAHWASSGDLYQVRALLTRHADVNRPSGDTATPLIRASLRGHLPVVDVLLAHGANPDVADECGRTALHYAAGCDQSTIVRRLVQAGANVNSRDAQGLTPLAMAAARGLVTTIEALLDAGADASCSDERGMTALMWAANGDGGHASAIRALLAAAGATPSVALDAVDARGATALTIARLRGHFDCIIALEEAEARRLVVVKPPVVGADVVVTNETDGRQLADVASLTARIDLGAAADAVADETGGNAITTCTTSATKATGRSCS